MKFAYFCIMSELTDNRYSQNEDRPLRILLLGDASNFHNCLAQGLRRMGHDVTVASDGSKWMDTERNIDLSRPLPGKAGGLMLWLKIKSMLAKRFSGYDVVSLYKYFATLKPKRLHKIFDYLITHNHRVFTCVLSADPHYIDTCLGKNPPIRYSEFHINRTPSEYAHASEDDIKRWFAPELTSLCNDIYSRSAGSVTALYEYHEICRSLLPEEKLAYGGIPVDTTTIDYVGTNPTGRKTRIFLGRHAGRLLEKGTDKLQVAAQRVVEAHPKACTLDIVENLPYSDYLQRLREADIVLDQLYSYTPATNALLAMAMGKTVVSGGEPEYYDFINEKYNHPIINAVPDDDDALFRSIERAVLQPERMSERGIKSRDFVIKHNDVMVVANRFLDFWISKL